MAIFKEFFKLWQALTQPEQRIWLLELIRHGLFATLVRGQVPTNQLGSGAAGGGDKFLADDQSYKTLASGVTHHGSLTGLADDDHTQYLNNARGDVRYIGASGVTFENLDANGDVGVGATQVAQGNHTHAVFDDAIKKTFTQAAHGFSAKTPIYRKSDSTWAKAKADTEATAEAIAIVESVDSDDFVAVESGFLACTGLTDGAVQWLSASTAGQMTEVEPDPTLYISKSLGVACAGGMIVKIDRGLQQGTSPYDASDIATNTALFDHNLSAADDTVQKALETLDELVSAAHAATHVTGGGDTIANAIAGGNSGLMSGADKTKLDGIAAGAEVNVNADWNSIGGDSEILNKPSIPTQYTDEMAQDAVGAMVSGSLVYTDATPSLELSGDNATPGANKVYGTDGSGAKGWKNDPGTGSVDLDQLENSVIMLTWQVYSEDTLFDDLIIDDLEDNTGIDLVNSVGTYDAALDLFKKVGAQAGVSVDVDYVDGNDFGQLDRKGSITTWTQDSGVYGHYNVACADVVPGQQVIFADLGYATIVSKTGDGTGNSSVRLSAAHATGTVSYIISLVYSGSSVVINSIVGGDGANNASTTDALPTMTSNTTPSPYVTSATDETYGAVWQAINKSDASYWQPDGYLNQWVKIDLGSGNAKIINKCRFKARNATPTYMPTSCTIAGSNNDSTWTDLASYAITDPGANAWEASWHTWDSMTAYRYYRWTVSGDAAVIINEIAAVIAQTAVPANVCVAITQDGHTRTNCTTWEDLNSVACTQNALGYKYVAVRFDVATTWYAYVSGQRAIVQYTTEWEYKDAAGAWQNATVNSELGALEQALDIAQNQMTATQFAALTEANLDTLGWSVTVDSMDIAVGFKVNGTDIPTVDKFTWNVDIAALDLVFITNSWEASSNDPDDAYAVLWLEPQEAYSLGTDLKVFVSMNDGTNYEEMTTLELFREIGTADFVRADITGLTARTDKTMRLKCTAPTSKNIQVSAWSLGVKYL